MHFRVRASPKVIKIEILNVTLLGHLERLLSLCQLNMQNDSYHSFNMVIMNETVPAVENVHIP